MKRRGLVTAAVGVVALAAVATGLVGVAVLLGSGGRTVEIPSDESPPATPGADTQAAFAQTRVFFGHQSVGADIIGGLSAVYTGTSTSPDLVESRTAQPGTGGVFQHAAVGANGDPSGKITDFAALLNGGIGDDVDVALMKLCYIDFTSSTDPRALFEEYATTMDALERAYPDVTFLYTTAPLTVDPGWAQKATSTFKVWLGRTTSNTPENLVRGQYNDLIRERYGSTGRLYDIAALESRLDDGYHAGKEYEGATYMVMNPDLASDGAHLNERGARLLAEGLVRLVAALPRDT
ncbi:hypothetical protein [Propionicicella superfundia]|uniref:hypothetical protein n=1 Tax=Propionicicella superfundia TaxID=348582 RepID=UPI000421FCDF|nr:hypothetical protein [Propionicicella superfundia]